MYDDLEGTDAESDTQLLRTPVPSGLAGKRGRGKFYQDDRLLAAAVGYSPDNSPTYIWQMWQYTWAKDYLNNTIAHEPTLEQ